MNNFSLADLEGIDHRQPILIAGPTASGKSDLALQIARRYGGLVVNADAIQVYSNWRVLSARPSQQDEAEIDHALYGHLGREANYSVGHWLRDLKPLLSGDKRPIITGGTGLYFTALTQGLAELPQISESIRKEANARVQKFGYQ
ncbi:MAG: tRNA (adenosine(37)-N6)-dimethylallyltransferase MiaA, partial [Marinovum sp.]|nr:tRNA (adenosine(37)-N6)-dimethylallyltransferase MiaA [Marinovum sp.]